MGCVPMESARLCRWARRAARARRRASTRYLIRVAVAFVVTSAVRHQTSRYRCRVAYMPNQGLPCNLMQVTLRRFYRPEDISRDIAYSAEYTDVYESKETLAVPLDDVVSKCSVLPPGQPITGANTSIVPPAHLLCLCMTPSLRSCSPRSVLIKVWLSCAPGVTTFTNAGTFDRKSGKVAYAKAAERAADDAMDAQPAAPARCSYCLWAVWDATLQ